MGKICVKFTFPFLILVFVHAGSRWKGRHDHCGADSYVNSIFSIAIGAVTQTGGPAYYGEACPGVMAVTLTGANVGGSLPLVSVHHLMHNKVYC